MSSNSPISRFENFARQLVEGSFDRLLSQPGPLTNVANQIVAAAEDSPPGSLTANRFIVRAHPETLAEIDRQSANASELMEEMLMRLGEQNRLIFAGALHVEFLADPAIAVGDAVITAKRNRLQDEPTAVMNRVEGSTAPLRMADAYLIINGRRHVVLEKAVNTIGRSLDNDVVIEDQGVSRRHAQIRWRSGRFEIFDLGSRAGTLLNRRRISRAELKSGDVVALGSAALIFGQEESNESGGDPEADRLAEVTQELSADDLP